MSLHKIYNFVGYNNLGLIIDQERKHWLLKPDKKLNVQDSDTGSIYQGRLDNLGNNIVVETHKDEAYTGSNMFEFTEDMFNDVFEPLASTLPYNNSLNGLMYECIKASKVAYTIGNNTSYKNYKVKFTNCQEVIIPFGDSLDTSNVYAGKWLKTTTYPTILLPDGNNEFNIEIQLQYKSNVSGCVFYYPLEENIQPLSLTKLSDSVYVTEAITDSTFIGYPIYWFTSTNTNVGPTVSISNNISNGKTLLYISNPGNSSKYNAQIFCCVDGNNNATPNGGATSDWKITCETVNGDFTNTTDDIYIPIDMSSIKMVQISTGTEYSIPITGNSNDVLTLTSINKWTRSGDTAETTMSGFDTNCYAVQHIDPLIPLFNIHLDESILFMSNTDDVGYAGVQFSSEPYSDTIPRYPYDLNKWDGIPSWLQSSDTVPQHAAIYALHNTDIYDPTDVKTRQTAALLFDPGKPKTDSGQTYTNDQRGRVYLLSNDEAVYVNNADPDNQNIKPPRTLARICDIPTSFTQLSDMEGLAPTTVVDKNYVHTDACYTTGEKNKLYNVITSKWVRPSHVDSDGTPISSYAASDNDYIFNSIADLNKVDLYSETNDLREYVNLNPLVDPHNVAIDIITASGSGYAVSDVGVVIIGGASLNYIVDTVDTNGGVTTAHLSPQSDTFINLSNFDLIPNSSGNTNIYGTSPITGTGTGLTFTMVITNYSEIYTHRGDIFDGLYALVKHPSGIWLYQYESDLWVKKTLVSEAETSSIITSYGGLSNTDSYMTSIVSSIRVLPVSVKDNRQPRTSINALTTSSFVNVIDDAVSPYDKENNTRTVVDINKLFCTGIYNDKASSHSEEFVLQQLTNNNRLNYDCYVIWKWVDPNDLNNNNFIYGVINRSFNNYMSTDVSTFLPNNALNYPSYVHTNEQTTVVWNIDNMTLMWVYDPRSTVHETYSIDKDTKDIVINRTTRSWNDIDTSSSLKLIDDNGKLLFNVCTNNPIQSPYTMKTNDPIYQQPRFTNIGKFGESITELPIGSWKLVFPRTNSYTLSNNQNGMTFNAIKMDVIRGDDLGNVGDVRNEQGEIVNKKILVIDKQSSGSVLKVYNGQTKTWDKI